jgi:hypothetical protein
MTRFGVPDHDMPENLPPSGWGPASSDERDLDAVLEGHLAEVPDALLPVADVLDALCAAPAPDELWGEARIMAEFRAHGPGGVARPSEPAPTRPLSVLPAAPSPRRRPVRRRGRRQGPRPEGGWAGALTGVAAAAAIVVAVAFTGNLPAPIERLAHLGHPTTSPAASGASSHSAAPKTETKSASVQPAPLPSATHSTEPAQRDARTTCDDYYGDFLKHPVPPSRLSAEMSLWRELTELAHSTSPLKVYQYCARYVSGMFQHWMPEFGQYPASPHTSAGSQASAGSQGSAGNQGSAGSQGSDQSGSRDTPAAQDGLQGGQQPSSGAAAPALTPSVTPSAPR